MMKNLYVNNEEVTCKKIFIFKHWNQKKNKNKKRGINVLFYNYFQN